MRSAFGRALAITVALLSAGCDKSPAEPAGLDLSGTWSGNGSDSQGAETFTWVVAQTGPNISGAVRTLPADPTDGSCASCHKNKFGTILGTLANGNLAVTMTFPTGGDVPTPICSVTMNAVATVVTSRQIVANYSGGDSCEGPFVDGAFTIVKK